MGTARVRVRVRVGVRVRVRVWVRVGVRVRPVLWVQVGAEHWFTIHAYQGQVRGSGGHGVTGSEGQRVRNGPCYSPVWPSR